MRHSRIIGFFTVLLISVLFCTGALCQGGQGAQPTPTPTRMPTATLVPTETPSAAEPTPTATPAATTEATPTAVATLSAGDCVTDRDAIQAAVDAYYRDQGKWPTADGRPGAIVWSKMVNEYLPYHPYTRVHCYWQVNSYPEGKVCVPPAYMC